MPQYIIHYRDPVLGPTKVVTSNFNTSHSGSGIVFGIADTPAEVFVPWHAVDIVSQNIEQHRPDPEDYNSEGNSWQVVDNSWQAIGDYDMALVRYKDANSLRHLL